MGAERIHFARTAGRMRHGVLDIYSAPRNDLLRPGVQRAGRLHRLIERICIDELEPLFPIGVVVVEIPDMHVRELGCCLGNIGADHFAAEMFPEPSNLETVARAVADTGLAKPMSLGGRPRLPLAWLRRPIYS